MNEMISKVRFIFQKEAKPVQTSAFAEKEEIISDLQSAKDELDTAISNFSFATDPELIEVYSYQIKAAQAKYSYHLMRAKKLTT